MYNEMINLFKNKKVCVLGYGKEGKASYNFLIKNDITDITVVDKVKQEVPNCIYGDNYLDNLEKYDIILKSPGIVLENVSKIKDKLTSQLELIMEYSKCHIIGITGSKGKSTTTTLIYQMLKDQGKDAYLLGNIGTAIFEYIDVFKEDSYLVIEMSALQLEYIKRSPKIGVIVNLFEEHLDHFGTKDNYYNAKMNMFKFQDSNCYGIYSNENDELRNRVLNNNYSTNLIPVGFNNEIVHADDNYIYIDNKKVYNLSDERLLVGKHNTIDIMYALKVIDLLGLDLERAVKTINEFKPLEHRMELVGTYDDITFYNDAIATIPNATINCIEALKKVDTLITGGKDRGIDYSPLIDYINSSSITNVICMPETGYNYADKLNKKVYKVDELEDAVNLAKEITEKGKICLLSPSAASYNKYKNFEEKGKMYKKFVRGE